MRIVSIMLSLIMLSGCMTPKRLMNRARLLAFDDREHTVISVLGEPMRYELKGPETAFLYCSTGLELNAYVVIMMEPDSVQTLSAWIEKNPATDCSRSKDFKPHWSR